MIMTRLLVVTVILTVVLGGFAGCDGDDGVGMSGRPPRAAGTIEDGKQKFFVGQIECPVCGGQPIKAEHHAQVDGRRLYFDRAECADKFESERQRYLREYCDKMGIEMPDTHAEGNGS